jgi:hypothetical protein
MTHTLKITNGAKILAASLLTVPEQFVTPAEVLRAAYLHEALIKDASDKQIQEINQEIEFECTEAQRDLLKKSVEKNASHIPPSPHSVSLLTSLVFEQ